MLYLLHLISWANDALDVAIFESLKRSLVMAFHLQHCSLVSAVALEPREPPAAELFEVDDSIFVDVKVL